MQKYRETTVDSLEVLLGAGRESRDHFGVSAWFRGHADGDWPLRPQVARPEIIDKSRRLDFEDAMARKFMRRARTRHSNAPNANDCPAWLFLMQHYGLPTRLLDWSESLLLAAYFAVCDSKRWDRSACIWALDPRKLNKLTLGRSLSVTPHDSVGHLAASLPFMHDNFAAMNEENRSLAKQLAHGVVAIEPDEVDLRMMLQQSVFTIHGSLVEDETAAFPADALIKYIIPADLKSTFAEALACAGVRRSTVFPDLENLATELRDETRVAPSDAAEQADAPRA